MYITERYRTQRCGFPLCLRAFSSLSDFIIRYFLCCCYIIVVHQSNLRTIYASHWGRITVMTPENVNLTICSYLYLIFYQHNLNCNPVWICEFLNTSSYQLLLIWCSFSYFLIKAIDIKAFSSERFKSNFTRVLWLISLHAFRSAKLLNN